MEFKVSSSQLLRTVNTLGGIISNNNSLPILDNFLFELSGDKLTLTASDLETTLIDTIDVQGISDGRITVPAKMLSEILKTFPEQPLEFSTRDQENTVELKYGYGENEGKCDLPAQPAEEYPKTPSLNDPVQTVITSEILSEAISKTLFATGNDEMRPVMSGVFFNFSPQGLTFVGTDAHKLVKYVREDISSSESIEFIMPKKPLNLMKSILSSLATDVTIKFNSTNACFEFDNTILVCRLIDGKYPNYEAVIPKDNPNQLLIDRQMFQSALRRIALFSNKTTNQIRLRLNGSEISLSAEDNDFNKKAVEKIPGAYRGTDLEIGFNSRFLLEMLSNLESREVTLDMSVPNRAGILKPVESNEGEVITMLVMPVMLNN